MSSISSSAGSKSSASATTTTMTTSVMLCPKCGGAVSPPSDFHGRACTCTRVGSSPSTSSTSSSPAPLNDPAHSALGHKLCCVCSADVTHARRMKDHAGRYWCYECGAADQMKKGKAMSIACHDCKRNLPPAQVLKHGNDYVCKECLEQRKLHGRRHAKHSTRGGQAGEPSQARSFALGFGVVMILAGVALMAMYYMDML